MVDVPGSPYVRPMHLNRPDGTLLHLATSGPDDGPVVVLVHGLAGSVELSWRSLGVIERLAAAGLHVVAVDLRGHGRTTTGDAREHLAQARLVEDVQAVVEQYAGRRTVLVGYSLGAALALLALQDGLRVDATVIAGAAASVIRWTDEDERRRAQTAAALRGATDVDADIAGFVAFFESIGVDTGALARLFDDHRPVVERWDAVAGGEILVVAGADDTMAAPIEELSIGCLRRPAIACRAITSPRRHRPSSSI